MDTSSTYRLAQTTKLALGLTAGLMLLNLSHAETFQVGSLMGTVPAGFSGPATFQLGPSFNHQWFGGDARASQFKLTEQPVRNGLVQQMPSYTQAWINSFSRSVHNLSLDRMDITNQNGLIVSRLRYHYTINGTPHHALTFLAVTSTQLVSLTADQEGNLNPNDPIWQLMQQALGALKPDTPSSLPASS